MQQQLTVQVGHTAEAFPTCGMATVMCLLVPHCIDKLRSAAVLHALSNTCKCAPYPLTRWLKYFVPCLL